MIRIKNARFIGDTSKYQVSRFNKGLTDKILLKTGQRITPSPSDVVYVNDHKQMHTDRYVCVFNKLVHAEETTDGKIDRVQRKHLSVQLALPKR